MRHSATFTFFILLSLLHSRAISNENDSASNHKEYAIVAGDTLTGEIKLSMEHNRIIVSEDKVNQILTARQVSRVTVDGKSYVGGHIEGTYYLFEEVVHIQSSLVYKLGIENTDKLHIGPWFLFENGQVKPVEKSKRLMAIFQADAKWMKQHMKANDLKPENKEDMIRAFEYFQETAVN